MDVYPRGRMGHFGDDARDERYVEPVQLVCDAVIGERGDAGIAEDRLPGALRGRVALVSRADVAGQHPADLRKALDETKRRLARLRFADNAVNRLLLVARKAEPPVDLFGQQEKYPVDGGPEVVAHGTRLELGMAVETGEKNGAQKVHRFGQRIDRGHGDLVVRSVENRFVRFGPAEFADDAVEQLIVSAVAPVVFLVRTFRCALPACFFHIPTARKIDQSSRMMKCPWRYRAPAIEKSPVIRHRTRLPIHNRTSSPAVAGGGRADSDTALSI